MRFGLIIGDDALQQLRQGVGDIDRFALAVPAPLGEDSNLPALQSQITARNALRLRHPRLNHL